MSIEQVATPTTPRPLHGPQPHDPHATATGVTNTKLAMWLFLSSDCLFFGAFISTYLLYRGRSEEGPFPEDVYDIPFTSVTSFILLMSSLTMVLALAAIQRGDYRRLRIWLMATALFGATFIGGQVFEFTEFYREGLRLGTNVFGSSFFVLTGLHGAHVTGGIIWLLSLWGLATQGRLTSADAEKVEIAGLYWHFVDVVWIVIFTVVYLIPE
ncbi:MAG TPA: cytochrome c oxidase subunit 3 [Acidimicrobiia bacterium]|nr:cytochrome c oxidase subunit 3 [Acidimicrobiia bacterium]